ncbi:MAG: 4Fe-4S binding protein [Candidatus Cloacimonetes bacterium]|nr:4Fe-4S binding protein [Candidatus Cloacimonadota bacterium]
MKRDVIKIDEEKCIGCGACIPGCPEGALQMIDGKARLVSDLFCDGLGACLGECPVGAIEVEKREAEPYDEVRVMRDNIVPKGINTIKAHLKHLKEHGQTEFYNQAMSVLVEKGIKIEEPEEKKQVQGESCGCAGSQIKHLTPDTPVAETVTDASSQLSQWPVQLALMNPSAPYFDKAELLIAADCAPFAYGNFHQRFIKGKIVIMFCPKLDQTIEMYIDKLAQIFTLHEIKSVSIVRMEVPCCGGMEIILQKALERANKVKMVKVDIITIDGKIR